MKRRFSDKELFALRNYVPINHLIEHNLQIPCKISEGYFRFLCPQCNEFRTATNLKTNLARCFKCSINFNTIEIIMVYLNKSFVESVKYLKIYQQSVNRFANDNALAKTNVQLTEPLSIQAIFKKLSKDI